MGTIDCLKPLALTSAQKRVWISQQIRPESTHYNLPVAYRITGPLDISRFRKALSDVVLLNESFRSAFFTNSNGEPVVDLTFNIELPWKEIEVGQYIQNPRSWINNHLLSETTKPFDLTTPPLFRCYLYRIHENEFIFGLVIHHLIIDAWSLDIVMKKVGEFYHTPENGNRLWDDSQTRLSRYIQMERAPEIQALTQKHTDFWSDVLGRDYVPVSYPGDFPKTTLRSARSSFYKIPLVESTRSTILKLAKSRHTTPFSIYLGAFFLTLNRLTRQEDLTVGCICSGRDREEAQDLVGFFVNVLPFRLKVNQAGTVNEFLKGTQELSFEALMHQEVDYDRLMQILQPDRSSSQPSLFNVVFSYLNYSSCPLQIEGLATESLDIDKLETEYDLTFVVDEGFKTISVEYLSELYEEQTIRHLVDHYLNVLDQLESSINHSVKSIGSLTEADRDVLQRINREEIQPVSMSVKALLEQAMSTHPDEAEIIFKGLRISHRQLAEKANDLCRAILCRCKKKKPIVAILLDRSLDMLTTALAIIKSGGCYIPVDPYFPKERIRFILSDAQPDLIISTSDLSSLLTQDDFESELFLLDRTDPSSWKDLDSTAFFVEPAPNDLIYTIYTSGSTGNPKGVQIEHHSVANLLLSMRERLGLTRDDTFLAVTTLSFDIAALELFLPLLISCRLHIADHATVKDGETLSKKLADLDVTVMQATPTTWQMLIGSKWTGKSNLTVLTGGEELTTALAAELLKRSKSVWNLYGPTETTIWSSAYQLSTCRTISIGQPLANTRFHILDDNFRQVPMRVPGELCIEGEGLARGYLCRDELTKSKFINLDGKRLYRTGDLVSYHAEGIIRFLGRLDNQVKIRGHRIELDEIATRLLQHPSIGQCVVHPFSDQHDKRIIAYVVLKPGYNKIDDSDLKSFLRKTLPDYMVPSSFITMDEFPRTPNAKIDRKALPSPLERKSPTVSKSQEFKTSTTLILAEFWQELLGHHRFGPRDNFFDLGGHSLLVVQLMNRLNEEFDIDLPIKSFFKHPTIEQLSLLIDNELLRQIESANQTNEPDLIPLDDTVVNLNV